MRKKILFLLMILIVCSSYEISANTSPQKVIVAGKVLNYDSKIPLTLTLNRVGVNKEEANINIDNDGNFRTVI